MEHQKGRQTDLQTDGDCTDCSKTKMHSDSEQTRLSRLDTQHKMDKEQEDSAILSNYYSEEFQSGELDTHDSCIDKNSEIPENTAQSEKDAQSNKEKFMDFKCNRIPVESDTLHVSESEDEGVCLSSVTEEFQNLDIQERAYATHFGQCGHKSKCENVNDRITNTALLVYGKDSDGDTLLHIAIIQCCIDLALQFIRIAPWYDWLDIFNENLRQTPLHLAVLTRLKPVVRRLMVGGANVEMRDHNGDTPLHIACRRGHLDIVKVLLQPVTYEENLLNEYDVPYQRVPQDLELRNYEGFTCLHVAAANDHVDIMLYLLDHGSNVNVGDGKSGRTLLHFAAENNKIELTKVLLKQDSVSVDAKTYNGCTPLMFAKARNNSAMVDLLIEAGANTSCLEESDFSDSDED